MNNLYFGDYHTHTVYSDAVTSPEEAVRAAKAAGLKEIALTDHGFANKLLGLNRKKVKKLAAEIELLRPKYPDVRILQGIEADVIGFDGTLDMKAEEFDAFDLVIAGFHRFALAASFKEQFTFEFNNGFWAKSFGSSEKLIRKNTDALLSALEKYPVDVLAHINHNFRVRVGEVADFCAQKGIYVEINMKHLDVIEEVIDEIKDSGCLFIVNSDAHAPSKIGAFSAADEFIAAHSLPLDRIVNIDAAPEFGKRRKNG